MTELARHNNELRRFLVTIILLLVGFLFFPLLSRSQQVPLFQFQPQVETRWSSPENRNGLEGNAARENFGAKGHPSDPIEAGATDTLLNIQGTGIINRIWLTIDDRSPEMLRSLRLEMFWDNASRPAVSVPLSDFFGVGLGKITAFENALFTSPEGRSFTCFIPMPFRKAAKILIHNDSQKRLPHLFFDVNYTINQQWQDEYLYFHAYWHRDTATVPGIDFAFLPTVKGRGKFLGVTAGVQANPAYGDTWWGEGEVKMFLDDDQQYPTIAGTGTEDYIGTGWGQGLFSTRYSGCLIADDTLKLWSFYRFHIPDPVLFSKSCRVTIQQLGGNMRDKVIALQDDGVPIIPAVADIGGEFEALYQPGKIAKVKDLNLKDGWVNFYRSDDVSAISYFYLDQPSSNLPSIQPVGIRTYHLK